MTPSLLSAYCQLWGRCAAAAIWQPAAEQLRWQKLDMAHSRAGRTKGISSTWWTLGLLSVMKETIETFKLRGYQRDWPWGHCWGGAIRSLESLNDFKQEKAVGSIAMYNSKYPWNNDMGSHWRRFSSRMLSTWHTGSPALVAAAAGVPAALRLPSPEVQTLIVAALFNDSSSDRLYSPNDRDWYGRAWALVSSIWKSDTLGKSG